MNLILLFLTYSGGSPVNQLTYSRLHCWNVKLGEVKHMPGSLW